MEMLSLHVLWLTTWIDLVFKFILFQTPSFLCMRDYTWTVHFATIRVKFNKTAMLEPQTAVSGYDVDRWLQLRAVFGHTFN